MAGLERVAPVDRTWLRMDRPANLMVIVGVMMLSGPVDMARLEQTFAIRLLAFPRFRQRPETHASGTWWREDPHFDISHHLKRARLPGAGGKAELQRFTAELASVPLDASHPLWQFHLIEDYEGGAAVVCRIHHTIGDGSALMGVMLSLTDDRPDAPPVHAPRTHAPHWAEGWRDLFAPVTDTVSQGLRLSRDVVSGYLDLVTHPAKVLDYARDGGGIAAELAALSLMPNDSPTRFKGKPSGDKRVAWTDTIALPEVKAVGAALGCSVNDLLLAAVAGALRGYLTEKGDRTKGVEVRALVPVDLRPPGTEHELGNRFGVVAIALPVGLDNPLARLYEIHRRMEQLKHSYEPAVTLGLLSALGHAPKIVQDEVFDLLLSRATAVMTNVPGPQRPLYLAGARLKQWIFWVPQAGDIGMGVSILSFDGRVQFGLITDAALVPDPEAIIDRFAPEFEKFLYFVLLAPWDVPPPPEYATPTRRAGRNRRPG